MIKQNPIYVCDHCKKQIGEDTHYIYIDYDEWTNDGSVEIRNKKNTYSYDIHEEKHYCNVDCLCNDIKNKLNGVV